MRGGSETPNSESYLSAVWHLQISNDMGDPKIESMPQLELVYGEKDKKGAGRPAYKERATYYQETLRHIYSYISIGKRDGTL